MPVGKHVDREIPGDRESECRGLMEPVRAVYEREKFRIFYRCIKCGHEFGVRAAVARAMASQGPERGIVEKD